MAFEVEPTRVTGHRSGLSILLAIVLATAVVGLGVATRLSTAPPQKATTTSAATFDALHLPANLDCHDIGRSDCETAARAALALFAPSDGSVVAAGAWGSLVCSNALDCPPSLLTRDATPLGSVIVSFVSGPDAWVNVMARPQPTPAGTQQPMAYAWLVRWH